MMDDTDQDDKEQSSLIEGDADDDSREPGVMTRTAASTADHHHPDSFYHTITHASSSFSSSSSPLSSTSSYSSTNNARPTSCPIRKKKQPNKKRLKRKMDSEELQHVSDLSASSESNTTIHNHDQENLVKVDMDKTHGMGQVQLHDQDRQLHNSGSRKTSSSSIRVEIPDIWGDESINFTTSTLRVCKEQVLRPYWGLLVFIGWRGIGKESVNSHLRRWRVVNVIYTSIIIMLLLYTYMYEILACEWKLDIHGNKHTHHTHPPPTALKLNTTIPTTPTPPTTTEQLIPSHNDHQVWADPQRALDESKRHRHIHQHNMTTLVGGHNEGCHHIITTYLIPNLLHLLAYCLGLYYFRLQENEQLYALMEKVFLQATPHQARTASQHKMIIRLRFLLIIGSFWVLFTVFIQCLYIWAFDFPEMPLYTKIGKCGYWIMLVMELLGRTVFNSVILAIVMNYVTQCEMIKFYVQGLTTRLLEKSTDLKAAMKDLLTIRHSVSLLNGVISKMTSLVTFIVAELSIIGVCILIMNDIDDVKVWVYRGLFPFAWMVMLVLPLWQAARVNSIILRVQKISLEMRVFGYKGASILDLDSFLQFVTLIKPKAKLFHLPMLPAYLISAVVLAAFILLVLIQTGSVAIMDFVF